ncbi:MAG: diaminopimelate epimerase [Candidatus Lokiarchaeota archaeon]|nr:diaminopimelate epimerase [Candidatus Lokiarchaeota archaeon]
MNIIKLDNLDFEKYHGLGNDYIVVDDIKLKIPENKKSDLAKLLCKRNFSVGADGLIFVNKSEKADIKMRIFNSDGSEAEMCGNGIRCFSKYIYEHNITDKEIIDIETLKGIMSAKLTFKNKYSKIVSGVEINMGPPILECDEIPIIVEDDKLECINEPIIVLDKVFKFSAISMGNPHAVIFIEEQLNNNDLNKYGAAIETHKFFPKKTNVEFVQVLSKKECNFRVFERGVGITNSCGTGSCAAVVAGCILGKFDKNTQVIVHNDGGDLLICYTGENIFMEGPVKKVFNGNISKIQI